MIGMLELELDLLFSTGPPAREFAGPARPPPPAAGRPLPSPGRRLNATEVLRVCLS
jgi:hypothetical protein